MYYYLQEKIIQTFFPIFVLCCEEKFHLMNFNLFYFFSFHTVKFHVIIQLIILSFSVRKLNSLTKTILHYSEMQSLREKKKKKENFREIVVFYIGVKLSRFMGINVP